MNIFSIIIPTYNSANTVEAAIDSILQQSYTDFEILVIDALSTDDTIELIKSFNDARIKIVSERDKGIYDAMNKGIKLASGKWIFFIGSDDWLYGNKVLELIAEYIDSNPRTEIIYGNVHSSRLDGVYDGEFDKYKILQKNLCHQSIFFKREVFEKIGQFNITYKAHADWDHNMRWMLNPYIKNKYVNLVVAEYADGGFSSKNWDAKFNEEKIYKYLIYGRRLLPFKTRIQLLHRELKRSFRERNKSLFLGFVRNYGKIFIGV